MFQGKRVTSIKSSAQAMRVEERRVEERREEEEEEEEKYYNENCP